MTSPIPPPLLLDAVLDIAHEAGRRILAVYASDFAVTHKDDASPLTQADLAAHDYIVAALATLTPGLPVLSEEDCGVSVGTRRGWRRYWLVDPLDGTGEFIKRNGEFAVNIALVDGSRAVLGVIHAPVPDQSWFAAEGAGAFALHDGRRRPIRTRRVAMPAVYAISRSHQDPALQAFLAAAPPHATVTRGASLKFCLIASGQADLHPRTGETSEWDTAAGQCLVEQAGGQVLRLPERTPLRYNQRESLTNPPYVALGDPTHDWTAVLDMIGQCTRAGRP